MYGSCITGGTRDFPEAQFDFNGNVDEVEVDHLAVEKLSGELPMVEPLGLVVERCERIEPASVMSPHFPLLVSFTTI